MHASVIGDRCRTCTSTWWPGTGYSHEYWQDEVPQWPEAPRGLIPEITGFVGDLRAYLGTG
ncbi:MAG TPA: hypothetical protein VFV73_32460 [Streptosporangiaceae bacterium]|nr:hypothetical protein [Streptosporangiaceae bacterium]